MSTHDCSIGKSFTCIGSLSKIISSFEISSLALSFIASSLSVVACGDSAVEEPDHDDEEDDSETVLGQVFHSFLAVAELAGCFARR